MGAFVLADGASTTPAVSSAPSAPADAPAVVGAAAPAAAPAAPAAASAPASAPAPARWRWLLMVLSLVVLGVAAVGLVDTRDERKRAAGVVLSQQGHGRGLRRGELGAEGHGGVFVLEAEEDKRVGAGGGVTPPPAVASQPAAQQREPPQQPSGPEGRDYLPPIIIPNTTDTSGAATADAAGTDPRGFPTSLGRDAGRPAKVVLPRRIPPGGQKLPLVMVLHGWGSNGTHHDAYLGVSARVDDEALGKGFVAVLPDGMRNSKGYRFWNAPACCNRENMAVDDLGYLTELLAEAVQRLPVDPDRIYVVGHSNGGQMALYLACRTDVVRGLVSIAGFGLPPGCRVPRPCTALIVHGTEDNYVPYDLSPQVFTSWVEGQLCLPASRIQETRDYDCDVDVPAGPDPRYDGHRDANCGLPGNETIVTEYRSCANGEAIVAFWEMEGTAHTPAFSPKATDDMLALLLLGSK